jgi:hypothetical protein
MTRSRDVVFVRPAEGRLVVWCDVCRASVEILLPASIEHIAAVSDALVEVHRPCERKVRAKAVPA